MDNNSSYINKVRWFIEALSGNLNEELAKLAESDKRVSGKYEVLCVDRNSRVIGVKFLYEVPSDVKDRIYKVRDDFGFKFVIYRSLGDGKPMVYYEWPLGRQSYIAPRRRRLKKGQMFLGTHLGMPTKPPAIKKFGMV